MNGLVQKILTCLVAISIWWGSSQHAIAGALSDRIDRYPNWNTSSPATQHEGELTYPEWFKGRWIATSTQLEQIAPLAPAIVTPGFESNRKYIDKPIEFTVQFISKDLTKTVKFSPLNLPRLTSNLPAPKIVADRAFNGLNIATAYLGATNVKSVEIDPQNPTKQITQLTQDRQLETFVTGFDREIPADVGVGVGEASACAEASPLENRFISTELSQQIFRTSSSIYLNTVETTTSYQFFATPTPKITADQISAIYLSPQDPDYFRTIGKLGNQPVALYRYRLDLSPAPDSTVLN
jgi:hypothetical protein